MTTRLKLLMSLGNVRYLNGRRVNWRKPPPANKKMLWRDRTMYGRPVYGSFRTLCHLDRLDRLARRKYGKGIVVIQSAYNTSVAASAGTHDYDACLDIYIPGVSWWEQQRFFRANGFACWYRHPPLFGNHIHGFTLPEREGKSISDDYKVHGFKVGKYVDGGHSLYGRLVTSSQITDYYNEAFGLSGQHKAGSDKSWFPANKEATIFRLDKFVANRVKEMKKLEAM